MSKIYKCLKCDFPNLQKRINAICKKLEKHKLSYNFQILEETVELVPVFEIINSIPPVEIQRKPQPMEVVKYSFSMEELKIGDFLPVAVLEHTKSGNLVHLINENVQPQKKWFTISGNCEHCNSKRIRNKTVILLNSEGSYIQVGTSCINEYTGIEAKDIISIYKNISGITISDISYKSSNKFISNLVNTRDYLATCIDEIEKNVYYKNKTKYECFENISFSANSRQKADEIIEYFSKFEKVEDLQKVLNMDATFYWNISTILKSNYCKLSGFVAYAPIAYIKLLEIVGKNKTLDSQKAISKFRFKIGDKITISVFYTNSFSYVSSFNGGYSTTTSYIHLFKDGEGNVYKWKTTTPINVNTEEQITITGTLKAHETYKNECQNVLTRCKIK